MTPLPNMFPPGEIIQTFDFKDISDNQGYVEFEDFGTNEAGTIIRHLIRKDLLNNITSGTITTSGDTTAQTFTQVIDLDIDTSNFQLPKTLNGVLFISFGYSLVAPGGVTSSSRWRFKVRKWDGSTETDIATSAYSQTINKVNGTQPAIVTLSVDITNTIVPKGSKLRITLLGEAKNDGAGGDTPTLNNIANLIVLAPFRLET